MRDGAGGRLVLPARRLAAPALGPDLHRHRRLADQLDRRDHAVLARALPRRPRPGMRQLSRCCRASSRRCRDPAGRHRLAGDRARAGGEDGQHRGGQGDREARYAEGVLPAARAGPDRRAHRGGLPAGVPGHDRGRHAPRAPARCGATCHLVRGRP